MANIRTRLDLVARGGQDAAVLLSPAFVAEIDGLSEYATGADLEVAYVLAAAHWSRLRALLPSGRHHHDLQASIWHYLRVFTVAPRMVPMEIRPIVAKIAAEDAWTLSDRLEELIARFDRAGLLDDVDMAVIVGRRAVDVVPSDHPDRAMMLSNLCVALQTRFRHTGMRTDLDEAVEVGRAAVAEAPAGHPDRAAMLSNLGGALQCRSSRTMRLADIDDAIATGRQAVSNAGIDNPDRGKFMSNLALALGLRFEHTRLTADLNAAARIALQAVQATPLANPERAAYLSNLGAVLRTRFTVTNRLGDLDRAIALIGEAVETTPVGHPDHARYLYTWGQALSAKFAARGDATAYRRGLEVFQRGSAAGTAPMLARVECAVAEAELAGAAKAIEAADAAWVRALSMLPTLVDRGFAWGDRQRHLRVLAGIGTKAAATALARGDVTRAWRALEQARGVFLGQALGVRPVAGAFTADDWRGRPPTAAQLRHAAGGGTVVAVNVSEARCDALIVRDDGVDVVALPRLTAGDARAWADTIGGGADENQADSAAWIDVLDRMWDHIAEPVLAHLGYATTPAVGAVWPRIWWIGTGPMATLPLHAAGHHRDRPGPRRRTVIDRVVSSYTPTARMLRGIGAPPGPGGGPPLIVGISRAPGQPHLRSAGPEARFVASVVDGSEPPLLEDEATRQAVLARLPGTALAHFACPAVTAPDPADNCLMAADGPVPVRDLVGLDLGHTRLAYLSACPSAVAGAAPRDEVIHVASALQVAGFTQVIGTFSPVVDPAARAVSEQVYAELAAGSRPAQALHRAVRAVRDRRAGYPQSWAGWVHFGR